MPTRLDAGPPPRRGRGDAGTGLLASSAGVLAFLAFLLFAMQLLVGLHAASVVTSVAHEGAGRVASAAVAHDDPAAVHHAQQTAEVHMRELLGRQADVTTFDWSGTDDEEVVLRVTSVSPRFMLAGIQGRLGTDRIDRTVRARIERLR